MLLIDQLQKCLVDQCRRLKRVANPFLLHVVLRQPAEVVVHQLDKLRQA